MDNSTLVDQLKVVLASTFSLYLKTHNYHWNVTGPNFVQYHDYFGDLYTELHGYVDPIAEHIRALDAFAPGSLKRFAELSVVSDETSIPSTKFMFVRLTSDVEAVLDELRQAAQTAENLKQRGVVNFIEGLVDSFDKIRWQLKSVADE